MSLKTMTIAERQIWIQKTLNLSLPFLTGKPMNPQLAQGKNCENIIGICQIPVGIAGPLKIRMQPNPTTEQVHYLPLATTEGALVASVSRGCKAISQEGYVQTYGEVIGATRGPYLHVQDIAQGQAIIGWIKDHWQELKKVVNQVEPHAQLIDVEHQLVGKHLYLRFRFDTDAAMGMNMVTMATEAILKAITRVFDHVSDIVSGNFCVDKKAAFSSFYQGRGKRVWAEAHVSRQVVQTVLKTTPDAIVEVVRAKQHLGSMVSGSLGYNAHFANIVAAMYLATGQDIAHVVEGSLGITTAEVEGQDLYFSILMPSLMVGVVGGGTGLPTQQEALSILKLESTTREAALILAQLVAAGVLAGELSLTAALAAQDLGKAHQQLGRKK